MPASRRQQSLGKQFSIAAAALAALVLFMATVASWLLTQHQHRDSLAELAAAERDFHASSMATDLATINDRISDMAGSTLLATGLVDSAGRETYLVPFLAGFRRVNGVPIHVLFTDFEGREIASNGEARFSAAELAWLRETLAAGRPAVRVLPEGGHNWLVGLQPLVYARTSSPEGALFYKVALDEMRVPEGIAIRWGEPSGEEGARPMHEIPVPPLLAPLRLRLDGVGPRTARASTPPYLMLLAFALAAFVAVVFLGQRLAAHLTRDLRRLEEFSRGVAESGSAAGRAPEEGSAEVAGVAISFNRMLDRLQEQHDRLLAEQRKLSELADALREADRRKDDFLATLSHELRNPLAPVRNGLQLLKMTPAADRPRVVTMMERQVNLLVRLVDDLLEMSRITRDKIELRRGRIDLRAVVSSAIDTSRPLIEGNGHQLEVRTPDAPVVVDGDKVRLAQIVSNLLNNAATYTPRGGKIEVDLEAEGDTARVRVSDNGVGLDPADTPRIFEMFTRGQQQASLRAQGGLGIGLALSLRLARMHGGTLEAVSEGPGRGSSFTFSMPLLASAQADADAPLANGGVQAVAGREVLVVDDNEDAAESLAMLLRHLGHLVRSTHSGQAALEMLRERGADVVLLDIGMPEMDGYAAARHIIEAGGRRPYLIALTGWGQPQDRERARAAGFDHHLVKPVEMTVLEQAIRAAAIQPDPTVRCA